MKGKAKPGQELKVCYIQQFYEDAKTVIEADDPLDMIESAIRELGYGGDIKPALITYLAVTSRLLEMRLGAMPVHLLLMGPCSSGKSYTLGIIKNLIPAEAYHVIDAGSPRALIYEETPLEHKAVIFGEGDSLPAGEDNPAASAVRNLLQDHYLHYDVVTEDKVNGGFTVKRVNKEGPSVLLTTSTKSLGDQLMTRFFILEVGDSKEQISAALATQARIETQGIKPVDNALVAFQSYLQLQAPIKVIVPFAEKLVQLISNMNPSPRINRDYSRLISLIKVVALLRRHKRNVDSEGRIIAELADYETVRGLVNDMYVNSSTGATSEIRKLIEAVRERDAKRVSGEKVNNSILARDLNLRPEQVSRLAKKAIAAGWLVNSEDRKYHPANYALGEPLPESEGLPVINTFHTISQPVLNDSSFKNGVFHTFTPVTDSNTPSIRPCVNNPDYDCYEVGDSNKCSYDPENCEYKKERN